MLTLEYQSLVEIGSSPWDILRIQQRGSDEERDLFTSLRGFQLKSEVTITGARAANPRQMNITFQSWTCRVYDRYDWNYNEYLTVPNPDYGRRGADAVRPQDRELTVYHRNAERLERAGLAAPYNIESRPWRVTAPSVTRPAAVST